MDIKCKSCNSTYRYILKNFNFNSTTIVDHELSLRHIYNRVNNDIFSLNKYYSLLEKFKCNSTTIVDHKLSPWHMIESTMTFSLWLNWHQLSLTHDLQVLSVSHKHPLSSLVCAPPSDVMNDTLYKEIFILSIGYI